MVLLLASIVLSLLALYFVVGMPTVWEWIRPTDQGAVDFATLERPKAPNTYLVCPEGVCAATPDATSPTFACPADALYGAAIAAMVARGAIEKDRDWADLSVRFVDHTPILKFPDTVSIKVYPAGEAASTITIYSRSLFGSDDFGANAKRVNALLASLKDCADG